MAAKADSTGRRNTFDYIHFWQLVESFGRCLPTKGLAGSLKNDHTKKNGWNLLRFVSLPLEAFNDLLEEMVATI
jgi:hypothetical protein